MRVPNQIREAMVAHARFEYPNECCGLLAADEQGRLRMCYSLTNADASPTAYTIDPVEHLRAWSHAEARGWDLVAAFHSHPSSAAVPSATDQRLALEPDWLYFIVGNVDTRAPEIRCYWLKQGQVIEVDLDS